MNWSMFSIDLTVWELLLFAVAGVSAGVINTLAGSGSLITLPLLMFVAGLPASVANATNRVGVFLQAVVGVLGFRKMETTDFHNTSWILVPSVIGAVLGARIAVGLSERSMNYIIGGLMVFMLLVLLFRPERWIRESVGDTSRHRRPFNVAVFFIIGVYGGFLQVGVGIFILAALVLLNGFSLRSGNGIKLLLVTAFTLPALLLFLAYGQVHLGYGLLMAGFQAVGASLAVRFAARFQDANRWIYRLLIVIVAVSAFKMFLENA